MQAINSYWTATMAPIMMMTRQKLISYRGIAAQPSTNSQCQTSSLGYGTSKEFIFRFVFHLLDLDNLKASQGMLSSSHSLLYELI